MSKGKGKGSRRGGYRKRFRAMKHGIGATIKMIARLLPAIFVAGVEYNTYKGNPQVPGWLAALRGFAVCFTGIWVQNDGNVIWRPEYLVAGWGPTLVFAGANYAQKALHVRVNPFAGL